MELPPIVSSQAWEEARLELLVAETALTTARHALAAKRRRMPWTPVRNEYRFDSADGSVSLAELFNGRRQLIEQMGGTWNYLDLTALGRREEWEHSPDGYPQTPPYEWWNYHDAYPTAAGDS